MRSLKSHTQLMLGLTQVFLLEDMVRRYGSPGVFERDFQTIENRVKNEGFSFLTKTLPSLGKAFDTALCDGVFTPPKAFKRKKGRTDPAFLQVLFERVFTQDGLVKTDPCIAAVRDIRQVLYMYYKYKGDYNGDVIDNFIDDFRRTDSLLKWDARAIARAATVDDHSVRVLQSARTLLHDLLGAESFSDISPSHGPGAVATGEKNWDKMAFKRKYACIHEVYPYYSFFYSHAMDLASSVRTHYKKLEPYPSGTARVVLVPKDSRGPRLISMEPLEFQWVQQGLRKVLVPLIEAHPLTRGHVNFKSQEVNRRLALEGSISGDSVTLDMKEASDRIALGLVEYLFGGTDLLKRLFGTRTEATELPSGEVILLRKYAPMGSALCFPIMSLVHWSLAVATLHVHNRIPLQRARRAVYVYGDDIVIKGENHLPLITQFPVFDLKFNTGKCCTSGIFRESCGMDAVKGNNVTPLKIKAHIPKGPYDANSYLSYIEYSNTLYVKGYPSSAYFLRGLLHDIFGAIPEVSLESDTPGFIFKGDPTASVKSTFQCRFNAKLQRMEYKVRKPTYVIRHKSLDRSEYQRMLLANSGGADRVSRSLVVSRSIKSWRKLAIPSIQREIERDEPVFVAGVYSVPRRIKLTMRWSPDRVIGQGAES